MEVIEFKPHRLSGSMARQSLVPSLAAPAHARHPDDPMTQPAVELDQERTMAQDVAAAEAIDKAAAGNYVNHFRLGKTYVYLKDWMGPAGVRWLFNSQYINCICIHNMKCGTREFGIMVLFAWELVLRTQSEGLSVHMGSAEDADTLLRYDGRKNGVHIAADGALHFIMKTRVNRPVGSHIEFPCVCRLRDVKRHPVCLACEMKKICSGKATGDLLWDFSAHFAKTQITKDLELLQQDFATTKASEHWTWKSFRAGKATSMAQAGIGLGTILLAGEWRLAPFLQCLDQDAASGLPFNEQQVLEQGIEESDSDGE